MLRKLELLIVQLLFIVKTTNRNLKFYNILKGSRHLKVEGNQSPQLSRPSWMEMSSSL